MLRRLEVDVDTMERDEVVEALTVAGPRCPRGATPALLLEVPHGATRLDELETVRRQLRGSLPDRIEDFFLVNTDAGAPELALAIARAWVAAHPDRSARVLRCRIPRTLVDCNRILDGDRGGLTPGLPPYVEDPADRKRLTALHHRWSARVEQDAEAICGSGGTMLMVHTYAPRSVGVSVDADIVRNLHAAYQPDVVHTWPLRPEIDLIVRDPDGRVVIAQDRVDAFVAAFARAGWKAEVSGTYALHPITPPYHFAMRYPDRTLCLEARRDLFVESWRPFEEMQPDPSRVGALAAAVVDALGV